MPSSVFITGIGMVTPLGLDTASTWQALMSGKSGIDRISAFDPEGFESRIAGEVKGFDPENYMPRKEVRRTDRFAQFAVAAALEATNQAKLVVGKGIEPEKVAAIVGSGIGGLISLSQQYDVLRDRGPSRISPFLVPMMMADMGSGRVSMSLGAKGPNFCTVSACASGADAVGIGYEMIVRGDVEVAVVGGAEACICPIGIAGFNAVGALSTRYNEDPKSASRPFDAERDGFVAAEGAAMLVLESQECALRRGVQPIAELAGYGATADAYHITQPAPGGEGGARAMRIALQKAGLSPEEIDYINAHGTSTPMNDKLETEAIKAVFGKYSRNVQISSTKSMTGHLLGAAGALEAGICALAISQSGIPPTINLENPDPNCDLNYVPLVAHYGPIRTALSNSLGFGGHNSALALKAYTSR